MLICVKGTLEITIVEEYHELIDLYGLTSKEIKIVEVRN
jgi:hypothetical protein